MTIVNKIQRELDDLKDMLDRVNMLNDLFETAVSEDDRWTARRCLEELVFLNEKIDEFENNSSTYSASLKLKDLKLIPELW